jgi:hypothetical protein
MIELVEEDHCTGYRGLRSEEGLATTDNLQAGLQFEQNAAALYETRAIAA